MVRKGRSKSMFSRIRPSVWIAIFVILAVLLVFGVFVLVGTSLNSPEIGLIPIYGEITTQSQNDLFGTTVSSDQVVSEIEKADRDPNIKVIFLDINSPGGSVVASKAIAYAVHNCSKPTVAYINDIGTSGAYYIASAARLVIADEDSLTGSIGVIMELQNYAGLLKKLGVNITTIKEGKYKDIGNPARSLTPQEKSLLQNITLLAYEHFKRDILKFRGSKLKAPIDSFADGRPLTGYQAWKLGLVDELGTRQFAIEQAWRLAGGKGEPRVRNMKPRSSSLLSLLTSFSSLIHGPNAYTSMEIDAKP